MIVVVGAEMKKSTSGNNIPKDLVERLDARLKKAREYVKGNSRLLEMEFLKREARRNAK